MKICISGVILLLFLAGCVSHVEYVEFNPPVDKQVHTIGIPILQAPSFLLWDINDPALSFGLIGGLVHMAKTENRTNDISQNNYGFQYGKLLHQYLVKGLEDSGYRVVDLDVVRENPNKFLTSDANLDSLEVDAVLDIATMYLGYCNQTWPKIGSVEYGFRPCSRVAAKLVSPDLKNTLYSQTIMYGSHNAFMDGATNIEAPPEYFFDGFDKLEESKDQIFPSLERATKEIANEIIDQLTCGGS